MTPAPIARITKASIRTICESPLLTPETIELVAEAMGDEGVEMEGDVLFGVLDVVFLCDTIAGDSHLAAEGVQPIVDRRVVAPLDEVAPQGLVAIEEARVDAEGVGDKAFCGV